MDYSIRQSRLAATFKCMAEKCPSTCCSGWSVVWTKDEILRLKDSCTADLGERADIAFPCVDTYVPIQMNKDDLCPFFCDGLCSIQSQLGNEYLSYTCREYPGITRLDGDIFTHTCKNTCYRVMERVFLEDDCMELFLKETGETKIPAIITPFPAEYIEAADELGKIILQCSGDVRAVISELMNKAVYDINSEQYFKEIFGVDLIVTHNDEEMKRSEEVLNSYCKNAVNNLISSIYMEWRTHGISEELSPEENICVFLFSCDVMIKGAQGAAVYSSSHEEFICTMCDLAGMLYSDTHTAEKIIAYRNAHCY